MKLKELYQRRRILRNLEKRLNKKVATEESENNQLNKNIKILEFDIYFASQHRELYEMIYKDIHPSLREAVIDFFFEILSGTPQYVIPTVIIAGLSLITPDALGALLNLKLDALANAIISIFTFAVAFCAHVEIMQIEKRRLINRTQAYMRNQPKFTILNDIETTKEKVKQKEDELARQKERQKIVSSSLEKHQKQLKTVINEINNIDDVIKSLIQETVSQENLKESEISQDKNDQQLFQDSQGCSRKLTQ